jgi:drug/metabolite transporter (DMT)-like permease
MKQALIKVHISVFLAGFTGIMGALIQLNEGLLVWYRIFFTVIALFILIRWKGSLKRLPISSILKLIGIGFLIAMHWVCFYGSIKYANVSIGLVCFASSGLFTALFEPIFTQKKISVVEVILGLISLAGIYLIFHFDVRYRTGIMIGIGSAVLSALFSVLNKRHVNIAAPQTVMFYELGGGLLILTVLMPFYLRYFPTTTIFPSLKDMGWLLLLSLLCTVYAMDLMLQALRKVSAFTINLSLNLEPVYGIILAFIFFHENEKLNNSFYWGMSLIAVSVLLQIIRIIKFKKV